MLNFIKKSHIDSPALYLWVVCASLFAFSHYNPIDSGIEYYGTRFLFSFCLFMLVNNVKGLWQASAILWIEAAAMHVYFWAGVDGEFKDIGFWHENLETMIAILNSLELLVLMSVVPWRDAWRKLTTDNGSSWVAFSDGQMPILGIDKRDRTLQGQEIS